MNKKMLKQQRKLAIRNFKSKREEEFRKNKPKREPKATGRVAEYAYIPTRRSNFIAEAAELGDMPRRTYEEPVVPNYPEVTISASTPVENARLNASYWSSPEESYEAYYNNVRTSRQSYTVSVSNTDSTSTDNE